MVWIEEAEWNRMQRMIPIVCVDVLVVKRSEEGCLSHVGLILRDTPHEGLKWCTVGGRMLYGESLDEALCRQLLDALGDAIDIHPVHNDLPVYVAQYYPGLRACDGFDGVDPRKHAVGLTYCVELFGNIRPRNEAVDFRWFTLEELESHPEIGFNQKEMLLACCSRVQQHLRIKSA
ncbi:NUDIX hydrolase family protein [Paenibacillus sp. TRM 82003]|nr:NUDIX hydrolase family protein [Paenibacillus sp. TRM 82003]